MMVDYYNIIRKQSKYLEFSVNRFCHVETLDYDALTT